MGTLVVNNNGISPIFALRERKRADVIGSVMTDAKRLRCADPGLRMWLIGSFAEGTWDAFSDIDVVCVSNLQYSETDFKTSDQYPMDIFSLDEAAFQQRMSGSEIFRRSVDEGVSL